MTQLQQFIAVLNLNLKRNSFFFTFKKTKFIVQLVKLLTKHNYFIGYRMCDKNSSNIVIFFKLNFERTRPFLLSCDLILRANKVTFIKYHQCAHSSSSLLILSTTRGLMTNREALAKHLGGIVLCKIT